MTSSDPHAREYAAATAGMQEVYGRPHPGRTSVSEGRVVTTWAIGDHVMFRIPDRGTLMGAVLDVLIEDGEESQYHVAVHIPGKGREHFLVHNSDVLPF
jgi:hypothetical protein